MLIQYSLFILLEMAPKTPQGARDGGSPDPQQNRGGRSGGRGRGRGGSSGGGRDQNFSGHGHDVSPGNPTPPAHPSSRSLPLRNVPGDGSPRGGESTPGNIWNRGSRGHVSPPMRENMANYPRQVDRQQIQKEMENTRKARQIPGSVEPSDIEELLAAISKYEARDKLQIPADHSMRHVSGVPEPLPSPTNHRPWRVAVILDSLAALLTARPKHEVIATALRVDTNSKTIEFLLASNDDVPPKTISHLTRMWTALSQISSRYHELYPKSADDNTPTRDIKDSQLQQQIRDFTRQCIKFIFNKIQKRVNTRFTDFDNINFKMFSANHPFLRVRTSVNTLECSFTREQGSRFGKPLDQDDENWNLLMILLRECQKSIKAFFDSGGFSEAELRHVSHFVKWETYLRKIVGIMNDIDVLLRAATSSKCQHLFSLVFKTQVCPSQSSRAPSVPQTQKDWETVLEKALSHWEKQAIEYEPKVMNMSIIERDTAYMAQNVISRDLVLHCEINLLLAIAKAEVDRPHLAKAYSYIGVSKLSCRGCHVFFQAYNRAHNSRFITRGSHGKSYWPWKFPQNFAKSQETAMYMYRSLVQRWVNSYNGYQPEMTRLEPDSTAGSQTSQTMIVNDEADEKQLDEYMKKLENM